jgi:hypothetical protein
MAERQSIDVSRLECIAHASSWSRDNQIRWTELAIYYRPGERRPFVAQSIGRTKVRGEVDFTRQRVGKSIEEACRLFDNSRLHDEIVEQAQAWLDKHPETSGREPPCIQFDGAGGVRGALLWLYPAAAVDVPDIHLAKLFEADWGVPARTVTHALAQQRAGLRLPSWCLAFIGALQHFDRDAFHAMRRAG